MPAGWTIQQITHCSASLACSNSLPNHSSAAALGEADLTSAATIVKQPGKTIGSTAVATTATISRRVGKILTTYAATIVDQFVVDQATVDSSAAGVATTATIARQIGKPFSVTVASAATVVKRAGKAFAGTPVTTGGSIAPLYLHAGVTNPQTLSAGVTTAASLGATYIRNPVTTARALAATITTTASFNAVKVTPVIPGTDQQDVSALVAAVGGGVGY